MEKILVLDLGGQCSQLIARRVQEQHVYAEIKPYSRISVSEIASVGYKGVIFTGGPDSVYDKSSPITTRPSHEKHLTLKRVPAIIL